LFLPLKEIQKKKNKNGTKLTLVFLLFCFVVKEQQKRNTKEKIIKQVKNLKTNIGRF
jgi:hypothetical protein